MITLFVRYPRLIVLSIFLVCAAGLAALGVLGRQEDPSLTERFGSITIILPGADATRMEALVTRPMEAALLELVELDEVRSTTRANVSQIGISIREDLNPMRVEQAWSLIRDRVSSVRPSLPDGVQSIEVDRQYTGAATLVVALRWPDGSEASLGALSRLARDLEDNLRNLPGTKQTDVFGAPEEEVRVILDPESAASLGLSAADVAGLLARSDAKVPAGRLAGQSLDVTVEVAGAFTDLDRLRAVPVAAGPGGFLQLADIARIERGLREPPATLALRNNERAIFVAAYLEPNLQVDAWDGRAQAAVRAFADANPGVETEIIFAQADYVVDRLSGLAINLGFFGADRFRGAVLPDGLAQCGDRRLGPAAHRASGDGPHQCLRLAPAPDVGDGPGRGAGPADR